MHLTLKGCVTPDKRDYTSISINTKECIKPIQNARILTCMLCFRIGFCLALERDLLFLIQLQNIRYSIFTAGQLPIECYLMQKFGNLIFTEPSALRPHHFYLRSTRQNPQKSRPAASAIRQLIINSTKDPVISKK